MIKSKLVIMIFSAMILSAGRIHAQQHGRALADSNQISLYNEIFRQDSLFFGAFNTCSLVTYKNFLTDNFEFYHDLGGIHYLSEEMQSMNEMCARNSHIRRELIKSSLEVHKLGETGALEIGTHNFYHTNPGQSEHLSGTYKFIQVWQKTGSGWKLSRVISYSHGKMENN